MLHKKAFYTQKKNRKVIKVVKEHYLRDDVWCAAEGCSQCKHAATVLSASPQAYELLDQKPHYIIDLIEHPAFKDVIVLQTVLQEVNHLSQPIYARLRLLISDPDRRFYVFNNEHHRETYINRLKDESPNDRNDRAIRVAIKWYSEHLERNAKPDRLAVMMSDDADNRAKAKEAGIAAFSVREYVAAAMVSRPELMDIVADNSLTMDIDSKFTYKEHLLPSQVAAGIKAGAFHQGTLNISMHNYLEGTIMGLVDGTERQIYIIGRAHLNRAVQSDVVAVQMLPKNEWRGSPSVAVVEEEEEEEEDVVEDTKKDEVGVHNARDASGETAMEIVSPKFTTANGKGCGYRAKKLAPVCINLEIRYISGLNLRFISTNCSIDYVSNWILENRMVRYCGYIDKLSIKAAASSQNVFFYAMDRRIPKIKIRTRQAHTLKDQRIVVAIDSWPNTSRHPIGHFVKALGAAGDKETETEVLLLEHDVPYQEFAPQVLKELPPEGDKWMVQPKHFEGRIDLRELNICSIDPPGCTDIDDALHIRSLPNGNYEIGVHIADVTHFVKPNMTMDNEAAHRGTTVYLVDKRIDMLPSLLGTNLCSLRSNVDRLAFSCLWEITEDAEIVNVDFKKSVIRSKHSFTYEEAQNRIDDIRQQDDVTNGIRILNSLAKLLRQRRLDRGALTLASPEVRFNLENDSQDPVDVEMKELQETNALVEEFMLLANISVAEKIFSKFPDSSMLRRHAIPPDSNFEALEKAVSPLGITLKHDTSKALSDSLDAAIVSVHFYYKIIPNDLKFRTNLIRQVRPSPSHLMSGMISVASRPFF
ncbi:LOW QUALITY PROTEIN: hypothetical protein BC937DRAFT_87023 [Endogone sp. FLAS-F59071]|nr:LOW QUALITY PROTEIN: hypothetical protein BC937DRAFT_87023 [Endogone sp. FLAS-F59071]|eukprot:RUS19734.1 LOW QUALITY PROTEIN: hypothetical protein BC937DRAFT_87023 [Endogone sp. FLAS-F59071]